MPSATGLLKCSLAVTAVLTLLSISTFATANGAQATGTSTHFSVVVPSSEMSGGKFNYTVKALDANAEEVTGYARRTLTSSGSKTVLPANSNPSSGTGTLRAALATAGSRSITANSTMASSITGVSNSITRSAASISEVAELALTQTGLGIAFASNVLQSQMQVVFTTATKSLPCTATKDRSYSYKTGSTATFVLAGQPLYPVTIYFDAKCAKPYIVADITGATRIAVGQLRIKETATYHDLNGAILGSLTVNEMLTSTSKAIVANGLGIFTPASGARTPVQLGLYCTMPTNGSSMPCGGGVAQDIRSLKLAVGAVTPLTLVPVRNASGAITKLTFSGGGSVVTGPIGSLKLTNPVTTKLVVQGGTSYATTHAKGSAGAFDLFPPTPTSWTLTDAAHDQRILISVIDNTTRASNITITQISTGKTLAIGHVDQAGTGSITLSGSTLAKITSWTLEE